MIIHGILKGNGKEWEGSHNTDDKIFKFKTRLPGEGQYADMSFLSRMGFVFEEEEKIEITKSLFQSAWLSSARSEEAWQHLKELSANK